MSRPVRTALSALVLTLMLVLALACASCSRNEAQNETTRQDPAQQAAQVHDTRQDPALQSATHPAATRPDANRPDAALSDANRPAAPNQDNPDQAAPEQDDLLLDLAAHDQEQTWRADLAVGPDGVLRFTLETDQTASTCTADRYWMLGGPERTPPHFELSFRLCSCEPEPPPELMDALRPDPVLWVDLRPVDKPIATLYLFRLRPPPLTEVRHLDIEGLDRFIDEHPWEDSRKPCSTSTM